MTCPSELSWLQFVSGRRPLPSSCLPQFWANREGERSLDRLTMRELPCWKEWFPIFFSGVLHFFKPQTVWHWQCCSHCDTRHVATVSNHIQNKNMAMKLPTTSPYSRKVWCSTWLQAMLGRQPDALCAPEETCMAHAETLVVAILTKVMLCLTPSSVWLAMILLSDEEPPQSRREGVCLGCQR